MYVSVRLFYLSFHVLCFQLIIPEETPLAENVDFVKLARHEMSGGNIKNVVFRAAARSALREGGM